jgi:hypothetical protein
MDRHRAARVFAGAAVCWIAGAAVVLVWVLSAILADQSEHMRGHAVLGFIVTTPLYLVALAGVLILAAGRRSHEASAWTVV